MRTQWTTKGNRDAGSSSPCNRGLHRYLRNFGGGLNTPNHPPRYATGHCHSKTARNASRSVRVVRYGAVCGCRRKLIWRGITYRYNNIINKVLFWRRTHFVFASTPKLFFDSLRAGRSGDRILVGARFSPPVRTGPGPHPASYTRGTGSIPGVKRPGRGVDHPHPSSAEVKERVELYFYSPSGPLWSVLGRSLPLLYQNILTPKLSWDET